VADMMIHNAHSTNTLVKRTINMVITMHAQD
jgi:hypothetical protein